MAVAAAWSSEIRMHSALDSTPLSRAYSRRAFFLLQVLVSILLSPELVLTSPLIVLSSPPLFLFFLVLASPVPSLQRVATPTPQGR